MSERHQPGRRRYHHGVSYTHGLASKCLAISRIWPEDQLQLSEGVNVIVGRPNTGKSQWLRMIDFLLGDDKRPESAFSDDVAAKYHTVAATLNVNGNDWTITRSWRDPALVTKISVDGELMPVHAFTSKLLEGLQIPVVHYPQGNPMGHRTWPELGWRSLLRHMYRRQTFWADIADQQPPSEQHACMMQFLGLAEVLFSAEYGESVKLQKQIVQLQNAREQYVSMLQEVSRELLDEKELGVALTPESIALALDRYQNDIKVLQQRRQATLREMASSRPTTEDMVNQLGKTLASLRVQQEERAEAIQRTNERMRDLRVHREAIENEKLRIERAIEGGSLLSDLKITHCPACDQPLEERHVAVHHCHLCTRHLPTRLTEGSIDRLEFELEQLQDELGETDRLIGTVAENLRTLNLASKRADGRIERIETQLRPVHTEAAAVRPPEIAILDQQTGRAQERIAQLKRIRSALDRREAIAADMEVMQGKVTELEAQIQLAAQSINFDDASVALTDGMNTYLNVINEVKPNSWSQSAVDVLVRERDVAIRVGRSASGQGENSPVSPHDPRRPPRPPRVFERSGS